MSSSSAAPGQRSRGLEFAEQQLQRHGWRKGKGLGKQEDGIAEAIKVKVKCDTAGVGHSSAEQFTYHWWDHLFNSSAANIAVETGQDGVQVKQVSEQEGAITNKKPRKAAGEKDLLYGRFRKAATLLPGGEEPASAAVSSDSSEDDEDEKLDLSTARRLTDEELVKVCGGRTAHKGARHGLTMRAKLARLQEQEQAFLARCLPQERVEAPGVAANGLRKEKAAKKRKRKPREPAGDQSPDAGGAQEIRFPQEGSERTGKPRKKKKKEKKRRRGEEAGGSDS